MQADGLAGRQHGAQEVVIVDTAEPEISLHDPVGSDVAEADAADIPVLVENRLRRRAVGHPARHDAASKSRSPVDHRVDGARRCCHLGREENLVRALLAQHELLPCGEARRILVLERQRRSVRGYLNPLGARLEQRLRQPRRQGWIFEDQ